MKNRAFFLLSFVLFVACQTSRAKDEKRQDKAVPNVIAVNQGDVDFSDYFLDKTMRVDYIHTGNAEKEIFAIDQVVNDGVWPGSQTVLIDHLELGLYFFEVLDAETHILLYSRGFASIFGEWQTLPEASEEWGSFHESVRFPWPLKPVSLIIKKRNAHNKFQPIWSTVIDPSNRQVNKAERIHSEKVHAIVENGPAHEKLDIVVLGDGYHVSEMEKFGRDAKRLSQALLQTEPFNEHRNNINIRAVETPAAQSGVNKPHHGVFKHTPLSVSYSAFDSERYALTYDNRSVRNIASAVPYDFMVILINEKTYGGGGIYNLYTTVATDNLFSEYIMIHEMGHHMAALADEYYTSAVAYEIPEITVEPWETNVTALLDKDNLKWKDLVDEDMPIPSPWNKEVFDAFGYAIQKERDSLRSNHLPENRVEELFLRQLKQEKEFFSQEEYSGKVGAFEGANYNAKGLYRPQLNCIMYTRTNEFCLVCKQSISHVIEQYSK